MGYPLPYLTLPYLTLPYLTLPYLTLPYPTLPYPTLHGVVTAPLCMPRKAGASQPFATNPLAARLAPPGCCDLLNAPVRGTNPLPPTLQQQLGLPVPPKGAMQAAVAPINLLSL